MNRSCGVSQPDLNFVTHLLLSSSLAQYEKPCLCSHMVHRKNAQCIAVKVGAKAKLQSGWLLARVQTVGGGQEINKKVSFFFF